MKSRFRIPVRSLRPAVAVGLLLLLAGLAQLARPGAPLQPGAAPQPTAGFNAPELTFNAADRILILAPHPDDETIGNGGVIQRAVSLGLPVRVVFLTNGDANQWSFVLYRKQPELLPGQVEAMGLVRHDEAVAATSVLGLQPEQLTFLGYPDFGTLAIWTTHWRDEPPLRSLLTRVAQVPYANAYHPGAAYKGEEILADLEALLGEFRPTRVFLSHPADLNPDHMALYAFTRVALWDLGLTPQLYPYLVHDPHWPEPRGLAPDHPLTPPAALATQVTWWNLSLGSDEVIRKQAALAAHRTQYQSNARYLASFIRTNELFGDYAPTLLLAGDADVNLGPDAGRPGAEASEQLTDAERAAFVGVEWHTVRRVGNDLVLSLVLSKPLAEGVALSAYLFGYRPDKPFAAMPKIHVRVGELSHAAYDQTRELPEAGVQVSRDAHNIVLRVPLALLGDPDRALTAARTYMGDLPLDSAAWRVLELKAK